jgi:hypothetical protein
MITGVLDVGSNSVRLMLSEDGKTLSKRVVVTRLAEGLSADGRLKEIPMSRTLAAMGELKRAAVRAGAERLYAFATAAVRSAENGGEFVKKAAEAGIRLEVLSGGREAEIGLLGALNGRPGGVLDLGGASSELIVSDGSNVIYEYSLNLGSVRLLDLGGQDRARLTELIRSRIGAYGAVPACSLTAIGGTATQLAAIDLALEPYDPARVDGHILERPRLSALTDLLFSLSPEERKGLKGLQPERAEVIAGGALLLLSVLDYLRLSRITVSERDNLEGYLIWKNEYEQKK